ncbi:MAG: FAD/NAD(P)-binding oxidoreductase, partial [Thermoproteota archaeon]
TSKGVVVTTEVSGHLMIGPNAEDLPPDAKDDVGNTARGLEEVWQRARELWPRLPPRSMVIRTFAGLRPEPEGGDFVVGRTEVWGFVNAAGTRSPGLTAAPAIALRVRDELVELGIELREKGRWKATRRGIVSTVDLDWPERVERARRDPLRGRVVCRCNLVTEREVVEAIERARALGVRTPSVDSVKFRTGAAAGTCQGSFCRVRLVEILAREFGVPPWEVTLKGRGSEVGVGDVKVLLRSGGRGR